MINNFVQNGRQNGPSDLWRIRGETKDGIHFWLVGIWTSDLEICNHIWLQSYPWESPSSVSRLHGHSSDTARSASILRVKWAEFCGITKHSRIRILPFCKDVVATWLDFKFHNFCVAVAWDPRKTSLNTSWCASEEFWKIWSCLLPPSFKLGGLCSVCSLTCI